MEVLENISAIHKDHMRKTKDLLKAIRKHNQPKGDMNNIKKKKNPQFVLKSVSMWKDG